VEVNGVLDTNIVLYLLGGKLLKPLPAGSYAVSVITEIELLSFGGLEPSEEAVIREFLSGVSLVELDSTVRAQAIKLRKQHRLKVPDAIVAASAIVLGVELLTNDQQIARTPGVACRSLDLRS
jgi:predicted nucleic acid-binding protein